MLKLIPGTKGFYADSKSNIYGPDRIKRNTYVNGDGYITASVLTVDNKWVTFAVHRLSALAFLAKPSNPKRTEINHRDFNIKNNDIRNFEWVTPSENNIHSELFTANRNRPILRVDYKLKPFKLYNSIYEAGTELNLNVLDIWDAVKDKLLINEFAFTYMKCDATIPKELRKNYNSAFSNTVKKKPVKLKNIDTKEELVFESIGKASKFFNTSPSHLYQAIPKNGEVSLFRKKYQITYLNNVFLEYDEHSLQKARRHGSRQVVAYNLEDKQFSIYESAKSFIYLNKLSKKAVTTLLVKDKIRIVNNWIFLYFSEDNFKRIKAHVQFPETL